MERGGGEGEKKSGGRAWGRGGQPCKARGKAGGGCGGGAAGWMDGWRRESEGRSLFSPRPPRLSNGAVQLAQRSGEQERASEGVSHGR